MNTEFLDTFKKSAREQQLEINEKVKIMKEAFAEMLYIRLKEECGDMDGYLYHLNEFHKTLIDTYYEFTDEKGRPVPRYYPYSKQLVIMETAIEKLKEAIGEDLAYDLSMDGLKKLAARREERKRFRSISSGSKKERERFEVVKKSLPYAGHLDDKGEPKKFKKA